MMKSIYKIVLYCLLPVLGILSACSRDDSYTPDDNTGAMTFYSDIMQQKNRIAGNNFEQGDEIGVFVIPYENGNTTPGDIANANYYPNAKHTFNGSSWLLTTGRKIPWIDATTKVDIYAYHPFSVNLTAADVNNYIFSVNTDQQTKETYQSSDFLWANTKDIAPTSSSIGLLFKHALSKVKVNVKSEIDLPEGALANARITIKNIKQDGVVNLADGSVALYPNSATTDVVTLKTTPTSGFEATAEGIIIPQTVTGLTHFIQIDLGNNTRYNYITSGDITFEQGKERAFNITITRMGISVVVDAITEWEATTPIEGEIGKPVYKVFDINDIDWTASKVHKVYYKNVQIAEVAREYLFKSGTVDYQAIVVYPMNDEGKADLTKGFIAQVMNRTRNSSTNLYEPNSANVHGGSVIWSGSTIGSYIIGTSPLINKVEISNNGIAAAADNAITTLNVKPDVLTDIDGNNYSIVKIGIQYWTAENYKVEHYNDGDLLTYYYYNDDINNKAIYGGLYNWNTIVDSRFAPEGWKVPENNDFIAVWQYITPDAAKKMKANILWNDLTHGDDVTGFSGLPGGRRTNTGTYNEMYSYGQWWSTTATSTSDAYRLYMAAGSNALTNVALNKNYTQSIRLLRK